MRPTPDADALSSRRGRRILIALLILLLILLPLYLWPLRGGLGALPRVAALSGLPKDPRNPAALATIPADVWDALMAGAAQPPQGPPNPERPPKPRNLTMIAEHEPGAAPGAFDPGAGGFPGTALLGGSSPPSMLAGLTDQTQYKGSDEGSSPVSTPGQFGAGPYGEGQGNGSGWYGGGGFGGGFPNGLGPFGNGGPSFRNPIISLDPGDTAALQPTPEPTTIALVGLNVAVFSAIVWKRRHRQQETHSIG